MKAFKGVLGLSLCWGGQKASGRTECMKQDRVSRKQIAVRWRKASKEYWYDAPILSESMSWQLFWHSCIDTLFRVNHKAGGKTKPGSVAPELLPTLNVRESVYEDQGEASWWERRICRANVSAGAWEQAWVSLSWQWERQASRMDAQVEEMGEARAPKGAG